MSWEELQKGPAVYHADFRPIVIAKLAAPLIRMD